jgi:hypothetical protein
MPRSRAVLSFLAALACAGGLRAAPVVLTFEELGFGTKVLDQYAAQGVTFNGPTCVDYGLLGQPTGFAHSGQKGIQPCFAQEFCTVPIEMTFATPQRYVTAWVGFAGPTTYDFTFFITAYDASGNIITTGGVTLGPSATPIPIQTQIRAVADSRQIARAVIHASVDNQPASYFAVDDIEFDTFWPPGCNAASPPSVSWIQPADDDGTIDLSDAIAILAYLFVGSAPPAPPFPDCGIDPTAGEIGCEETNCP